MKKIKLIYQTSHEGAGHDCQEHEGLDTHRHSPDFLDGRKNLRSELDSLRGRQDVKGAPEEHGVQDHGGGQVGRESVLGHAGNVVGTFEVLRVKATLDHVPA